MIRRYTPLPRPTKPIARGGPPRKQNPERLASNWKRAHHSKARQKFVGRLPCAACGYDGDYLRHGAHTVTGGGSRKADYTSIIPLCGPCHIKQHGVNGGWLAIGMTAEGKRRAAENTEEMWQTHLNRGTDE